MPATPYVDTVLHNPLAVPAGVGNWLRSWESRIRAAWDALEAEDQMGVAENGSLPAFEEAREEIRELLLDRERSAFHLMLVRPLWQLTEGSAARDTFDRYGETVLERTRSAVELLRAVRPVRAEREAIVRRFGREFPNVLAERLRRDRARDDDFRRLRRAQDAHRLGQRLGRCRAHLAACATLLDSIGPDDGSGRVVPTDPLTLAELRVALARALRARRLEERLADAGREQRIVLSAQLRALALTAPEAARRTGGARRLQHSAAVLEQMLAIARPGSHEDVWLDGQDSPHWTGAIAAALAARGPERGRFTWLPGLIDRAPPSPPFEPSGGQSAGVVVRAIPLDDGLVFLSTSLPSAIRVWSASVRLGESVHCQAAPDDVGLHHAALIERDVALLFDGLVDTSGWYATDSRAQVRVIAEAGDGWFARIETRGQVRRTERPVWQSEGQGSDFRILRPAPVVPTDPSALPTVVVARERERSQGVFLGFELREARAGLLGDERTWSRGMTTRWSGANQAMRNEWRLFTALLRYQAHDPAGRGDLLALRPLCWATAVDGRTAIPLYRIPLATLEPPTRLRSWVAEDESHLVAVLRGAARIVEAIHGSGFALGVYHTEAFASSLSWAPDPLRPSPSILLAHAPCATPFDEPFTPPPPQADLAPAHYAMLRTPVLVPSVALSQAATQAIDLDAFAAFMLDLLLQQPLIDRDTLHWFDVSKVVHARATACAPRHAALVRWLMDAIDDPSGWRRLREMVRRLAGGESDNLADLVLAHGAV